jgi:NAD(P)-dependent dehydrogenase (short-subunit alcohol dehydrogenase family)
MDTTKATMTPPNGSGRLQGKVAFITGGAGGIGEATARMFAREGAAVAITDIRGESVGRIAADIVAAGGKAVACEADVTSEESIAAAVATVAHQFGAIHVLFNCAGGSLPEDAPVTEVDLGVWDKTMTLDLRGTILACRFVVPHIVAAGGGAVVNMSSGAALRGAGKAHIYAAAKGGIIALTRSLAGTYARANVRANAICSGRINTERIRRTYGIPGKRGASVDAMQVDELIKAYPFWFGEPEDIAHIALFLACDESRMITGAAIPADGGRSAY